MISAIVGSLIAVLVSLILCAVVYVDLHRRVLSISAQVSESILRLATIEAHVKNALEEVDRARKVVSDAREDYLRIEQDTDSLKSKYDKLRAQLAARARWEKDSTPTVANDGGAEIDVPGMFPMGIPQNNTGAGVKRRLFGTIPG